MRRSWDGWEVWVRCCLTGSGVRWGGADLVGCGCKHLVAMQVLLIVFSSSWVGVGMPTFSELTGTIWSVTDYCLHKDLIFKKFWVQNCYPRSQVAFGNVGEHISALQLEWILLIAWLPKIKTGIEFIGLYLADLKLFRKTRNESIKGLFLSNQHGRGEGCASAKREAALPAQC